MRDVFWSSSLAVRGKDARNEILLFRDPKIDHGFGSEGARRAAPDILALERTAGKVRRVLKLSAFRKMVSPSLRSLRQIRTPVERWNSYAGAFAIMTIEQAIIETAQPWLRAGEQRHRHSKKRQLSRRVVEPLHTISPRCGTMVLSHALRRSGAVRLMVD